MTTRRQFLRGTGATALGAGIATGTVRADHPGRQPEHVTLTYDTTMLDTYTPRLDLRNVEETPTLYGVKASSPDRETDALVYWAEYTHQDGVTNYDSHYGDHEPVYVFVDDETGDVDQVLASVYHWLKGSATPSTLPMADTQPKLRVISPWHHYTAGSPDIAGTDLEVEDLTTVFDAWLQNGLEQDLAPGAVYNPWIMQHRPHWWRRGSLLGVSVQAYQIELYRMLGFGTAGEL